MTNKQFESNVINSFQFAKEDIRELYEHMSFVLSQLEGLRQENNFLHQRVEELQKKKRRVRKASNSIKAAKVQSKRYVAAITSNKVHDSNCPFAKNIKPKNKISLQSKASALNQGYKLCKCLS
jgi:uncharacterized coiled-coil DUF342 family protein